MGVGGPKQMCLEDVREFVAWYGFAESSVFSNPNVSGFLTDDDHEAVALECDTHGGAVA